MVVGAVLFVGENADDCKALLNVTLAGRPPVFATVRFFVEGTPTRVVPKSMVDGVESCAGESSYVKCLVTLTATFPLMCNGYNPSVMATDEVMSPKEKLL